GYRADLRYRVVKRLEQLEGQGGHALPRNFAEALQLAADQAKQIEAMAEDVAAHERLTKADGSMCFRDSAKSMQVRPIELTNYMARNRWIYRQSQNGPWLAYQDKITAGYLEHKVTTVDRSDGTEKAVTQCRITAKGLSKLAKLMGDRA
ncbi:phage antirepressor KilAC domain-containing protein, partial [Paracoccus sp. PXZ]